MNRSFRHHLRRGFTLIELLVVISIIGLVVGLGLPFLSRMLDGNKVSAGVNTLSTAVQTARLIATSQQPPISSSVTGGYSGGALVITPPAVGELRVTVNDVFATDGGNRLEDNGQNGYRDVADLDYITQASGTRLVGIIRSQAEGLQFIEAPFAIRFDEDGSLLPSPRSTLGPGNAFDPLFVHYDSDNDDRYDVSADRPGSWDSTDFTSFTTDFTNDAEKSEIGPMERLESVLAVRVVRIDEVNPANPEEDYADAVFSRFTGVPVVTRFPGRSNQ